MRTFYDIKNFKELCKGIYVVGGITIPMDYVDIDNVRLLYPYYIHLLHTPLYLRMSRNRLIGKHSNKTFTIRPVDKMLDITITQSMLDGVGRYFTITNNYTIESRQLKYFIEQNL